MKILQFSFAVSTSLHREALEQNYQRVLDIYHIYYTKIMYWYQVEKYVSLLYNGNSWIMVLGALVYHIIIILKYKNTEFSVIWIVNNWTQDKTYEDNILNTSIIFHKEFFLCIIILEIFMIYWMNSKITNAMLFKFWWNHRQISTITIPR